MCAKRTRAVHIRGFHSPSTRSPSNALKMSTSLVDHRDAFKSTRVCLHDGRNPSTTVVQKHMADPEQNA